MLLRLTLGLAVLCTVTALQPTPKSGTFTVGVGSSDITGAIAEVGLMGYAMLNQKSAGLHMRSRARAYLFIDETTGQRNVFVNMDLCMAFHDMVQDVLKLLNAKYPGLYSYQNLVISGTHTHSTTAGYSRRILYEIASLGFYKDNFEAVVNGVFAAIVQAHENPVPNASLWLSTSEMDHGNINRSPASYDADPAEEKAKYKYNTDHDVTLLRLEDSNGNPIGMVSWFAVHGTSMNNTNSLFSSDNKGFAEQVFERYVNGPQYLAGTGPFIAAFAQSNEGDVSPNLNGPKCPDGSPCDYVTSTCGPDNTTLTCIATGPGATDFESCQIIGQRQADHAWALWNNASAWVPISGGVGSVHQFVDMSNVTIPAQWTTTGQEEVTCTAALGYGFAGGTTDGPGDFPFEQGTTNKTANPFWEWITSFLGKPSAGQIACHDPKPILLDVSIYEPAPWVDQILPIQILSVGQLYIVAVPGEFTTMSGRRLRATISEYLIANGANPNCRVVIAGLANSYSHYIATYEEYQIQRYEGASTLYGPNTLAAYQMLYAGLAAALARGNPVPPGPTPPDLTNHTFSLLPPVIVDVAPAGKTFGSVWEDVQSSYTVNETVSVVFVGANPRNNLMTGSTFLTVQLLGANNQWQTVVADEDWSTKLYWSRRGTIAESYITITWDIPADAVAGTYRITHSGYYKEVVATFPYSGVSSEFQIV